MLFLAGWFLKLPFFFFLIHTILSVLHFCLWGREPRVEDLILFLAFRVLILLTSKQFIPIYPVDIIADSGFIIDSNVVFLHSLKCSSTVGWVCKFPLTLHAPWTSRGERVWPWTGEKIQTTTATLWEILSHPRVWSLSLGSYVLCNLSQTQKFINLAGVSSILLFKGQDLLHISGVLAKWSTWGSISWS